MKKVLFLSFTLFLITSHINADDDTVEIPKKIILDPFFQNIYKACKLLKESFDYMLEGKTIKSENKKKEALKILNKEIYPNRIINSEKICPFVHRKDSVWGWHFFEFSCNENGHFILWFDKESGMCIRDKNSLTSKKIFEQIEDISDFKEVDASIKIVPSGSIIGKGDGKCFDINIRNEVVVSCQVLSIKVKEKLNKDNSAE